MNLIEKLKFIFFGEIPESQSPQDKPEEIKKEVKTMGYKHVNSVGQTYWLHASAKNAKLRFFSKVEEGAIELPAGYEVVENARTKLPLVKKAV